MRSSAFRPVSRGQAQRRATVQPPRLSRLALALMGACLLGGPLLAGLPTPAQAQVAPQTLPRGLQVAQGQAQVVTQGAQMTVRNTPGAILNWQSFSIGASAGVYFDQANAASKVLNRVQGQDPSQILGSLSSNGQVWLQNPNGVLFGAGARVDVAGLVASTLRLGDSDFLAGRFRFTADAGSTAFVRNEGDLQTSFGGQIVLLGSQVQNTGSISAPGGNVSLAGATSVELVDTGLPNLAVRVDVPAGEVLNLGRLVSAGGRVDVHGAIVNQNGLVQAGSLGRDALGEVVLRASDTLTLGAASVTQATGAAGVTGGNVDLLGAQVAVLGQALVDVSGDAGGGRIRLGGGAEGRDRSVPNARAVYFGPDATLRADAGERGPGGNIVLWSDEATRAYGTLSARGGRLGGDGGFVETSGGWLDARPTGIDVTAPAGRAGTWLLDPNDIFITDDTSNINITGGPDFTTTGDSSSLGTFTLAQALNAGNSVTVSTGTAGSNSQAGDILMEFANLLVSPSAPVSLTLQAKRDINIYNTTIQSGGQPLSLIFTSAGNGVGAIEVSFSTINTAGGSLTLQGALAQQMPLPDGSFTAATHRAAVGYDPASAPWQTRLGNPTLAVHVLSSNIDLGAGTFSATGLSDSLGGVYVESDARITAARVQLSGWTSSGGSGLAGVTIDGTGTNIEATRSMELEGAGNIGVLLHPGAQVLLNAPLDPTATFSIKGMGAIYGVSILDGSNDPVEPTRGTPVRVVGGQLNITGRSLGQGVGLSVAGVAANLVPSEPTLDLATASGATFGDVGPGNGTLITAARIASPVTGLTTLSSEAKIFMNTVAISGGGTFNLSAPLVSLNDTSVHFANAATMNLHFATTGSTPLGVGITNSSIFTGGGDVRFGAQQVVCSTALGCSADGGFWLESAIGSSGLSVSGTTIDAGSGRIFGGAAAHTSASGAGLSLSGGSLSAGEINLLGRSDLGPGINFAGVEGAAGATLSLNGLATSDGVQLTNTHLSAPTLSLQGRSVFDGHGVVVGDNPGPNSTPVSLSATQLTISGQSADQAVDGTHVGVRVNGNSDITLSGRGAALISGNTVLMGGPVDQQATAFVTGDAASFTVNTTGSMRLLNTTLDFGAGGGTSVTLRSDTDSTLNGRVRLDSSDIKTGNGDFTITGGSGAAVGAHTFDTAGNTLPRNTLLLEGASGILFTGLHVNIDAGTGAVNLAGQAATDGRADQPTVGGGWGITVSSPTTIHGNSITLAGHGGDKGMGIDAGATTAGGTLNLAANSISVTGRGVGINPNDSRPYAGLAAGPGNQWLASGGALSVRTLSGRMNFEDSVLAGNSVLLDSVEAFNASVSDITATGDITVKGGGSGEGALSTDNSTFSAGGVLSLTGANAGSGGGVALLVGTQLLGSSVLVSGTATGATAVMASGATGHITASGGPVVINGRGTVGGPAVEFTGGWVVQAGLIDINTDNGLRLMPDSSSGNSPSFNASQAFNLAVVAPLGLTVGDGMPLLDGTALGHALASMPATSTATLHVTGNANTLAVRGPLDVPGRLRIEADGIELQPGALLSGGGSGDAVVLGGTSALPATFMVNTGGANVLNTPNGRWVVMVSSPAQTSLGGLQPAFTAYSLDARPWLQDAKGDFITPASGNALGYGVSPTGSGGGALSGSVSKVYDTFTTILLDPSSWTISGLLAGDQLVLSGGNLGTLDNKNVGTAKPVTLAPSTVFSVQDASGAPVYGYDVPVFTANVTPVSVAAVGAVAANKVYDGSTAATLASFGTVTPLAGDVLTLGGTPIASFADKNVGSAKTVLVSGGVTLQGADAGNYTLQPLPELAADITPRPLPVSGGVANNKVYDGTLQASLAGNGAITPVSGDVVILQGTAVGVFADKNVGNAKPVAVSGLSLAGADAGNYSLQLTGLFADITPATLTFTALAAQVVAGSALPVFTGALSGFVAGDDLANATTGELSWSSPATAASPAGSYAIQGGGLAAANYRFVQADSNATALTLTAAASNDTASNTTATNFAFALNAVQLPAVTSTPESGRVLDVVQSLASSAETGSTGYVYRSVNFSLLSRDEMQGLLAARAGYKKKVFATTISKLEQDPTLADVRGCGNEAELATGNCLITEALKVDIQAKAARAAVKPPKRAQRKLKQVTLPNIERKLALLIGINKYSDKRIPELVGAVPDTQAVKALLESRLGYEATVVADPSREAIIRAFNKLALEADANDSVIVYYAGHGVVLPAEGAGKSNGFWLPADSDAETPQTWISNADISRLVGLVGARQLMLISDSCYSGNLAGNEKVQFDSKVDTADMLSRKAAVVMSSGGDEPVADEGRNGHSIFAWHLMQNLGDLDNWQAGSVVFERVRAAVQKDFPQTPQYGASRTAGHQGNTDYLFERREFDGSITP